MKNRAMAAKLRSTKDIFYVRARTLTDRGTGEEEFIPGRRDQLPS